MTYEAHVSSFCVELKLYRGVLGDKGGHCRDQDLISHNGYCRHANHARRRSIPAGDALLQTLYALSGASCRPAAERAKRRRRRGTMAG